MLYCVGHEFCEVLYMEMVIDSFRINGRAVSCQRYGCGHINDTFLAVADSGVRYILQKINRLVFPDVEGLMRNIAAVCEFVAERSKDPRESMRIVRALDGGAYHTDEKGQCWRVYEFVERSLCLQSAQSPEDFYQSAVAFGRFQQQLSEFPAETLTETIKDFHNTPVRFRQLRDAMERDAAGRLRGVWEEAERVLAHEREAGALHAMRLSGELPLRVTHNDAKLNNVLLDETTRRALCVIDLDTVMPGLAMYDFGDSIRFGAATAAEDERDLSRVEMSLDLFRIYTRGFVTACPGLTDRELEMLPLGAKMMTLENAARFLADHLNGDVYYSIHREGHNLDRARTQLKPVDDMESKWDKMADIVREESGR